MKPLFKYIFNLILAIFSKEKRFLRLSPNTKGKLIFFDKKKKYFLNFYIRNKIDSVTADQIFTYEEYDLKFLKRYDELYNLYKKAISKNKYPLIIDGGANIGFSSYYFAKEFNHSCVVGIEPEIRNFSMMKKNCRKLNNIKFLKKALGPNDGFVKIENLNADNNAFRTKKTDEVLDSIEMISIDSIISDYSNYFPFIIKLDIEGFEKELFSKNISWVDKFPIIIIETHDWMLPGMSNSSSFLKVISQRKRDFIHRGENIFSISNETSFFI